nr:hypothetical protein [Rubrivivax gelatinosus]
MNHSKLSTSIEFNTLAEAIAIDRFRNCIDIDIKALKKATAIAAHLKPLTFANAPVVLVNDEVSNWLLETNNNDLRGTSFPLDAN